MSENPHEEAQTYFHALSNDKFRRGYDRIFREKEKIYKREYMGSWAPKDRLPTWEECSEKAASGESMTALEVFIYNQEPAADEGDRFRAMLADVVMEAETRTLRNF